MPHVKQETVAQGSTSAYLTLLKARLIGLVKTTLIITNSHGSNGIKYKVLVSNDPDGASTSFSEEKAESTLAAGAAARYVLSGPFAWIDVQIKDETEGNHGIGNCWLQACGE